MQICNRIIGVSGAFQLCSALVHLLYAFLNDILWQNNDGLSAVLDGGFDRGVPFCLLRRFDLRETNARSDGVLRVQFRCFLV